MMKETKGFTLVELMLVVLVMAIIATLATGAAMKSIKQAKEKRIDSTCVALEQALMNYRAAEQRWPVALDLQNDSSTVSFRNNNSKVFGPLLEDRRKPYLDPSGLFTKIPGLGVVSLRVALDKKMSPEVCSLGYPDPADGNVFKFFNVTFNVSLDTVNVGR